MPGQDTAVKSKVAARWCWLLFVGLVAINLVLFTMGSFAAWRGGTYVGWGNGPGGLDGMAEFSQMAFALMVGLAASTAIVWSGRSITSLLLAMAVFFGGLLVPIAFLVGGHLVEPCDHDWLDVNATIGNTRLCSGYGDISSRFHLLLHGSVGLVAAVAVAFTYRQLAFIGRWTPELIRGHAAAGRGRESGAPLVEVHRRTHCSPTKRSNDTP